MAILTVYTSDSDGFLYYSDAAYATAHNAASAEAKEVEGTGIRIGQFHNITNGTTINRGYLFFDTSAIASNATINLVKLGVALQQDVSALDWDLTAQNGQPTYPHDPLENGDYDEDYYSGDSHIAKSELTLNAYEYITIPTTYVTKEGATKLCLRGSRDIGSIEPDASTNEYINIWSGAVASSYKPKLIIYSNCEIPVVTTNAPTNKKATTCTGNGSSDSDLLVTEYGFEYGLIEEATWAVITSGTDLGEGAFSQTIPNLTANTTYHIRAYATNLLGTGYGSWVTFDTGDYPSYGIYSEANTASYRLYVSDDEAIAWRGYKGPYSGKQTLINITDITNKTKGGKVLKILPDAKGTFHVCVTLKEEIKS